MDVLDPDHILQGETRLSEGEVVAALLGWLQKAIHQPYLDLLRMGFPGYDATLRSSRAYTFKAQLRDLRIAAACVLSSAEERPDTKLIEQQETARKVDELIMRAQSYALAIQKELAKKNSVLKMDVDATDDESGERQFTIASVDRWVRQEYELCLIPGWDILPMEEPWPDEQKDDDSFDDDAPTKEETLNTPNREFGRSGPPSIDSKLQAPLKYIVGTPSQKTEQPYPDEDAALKAWTLSRVGRNFGVTFALFIEAFADEKLHDDHRDKGTPIVDKMAEVLGVLAAEYKLPEQKVETIRKRLAAALDVKVLAIKLDADRENKKKPPRR